MLLWYIYCVPKRDEPLRGDEVGWGLEGSVRGVYGGVTGKGGSGMGNRGVWEEPVVGRIASGLAVCSIADSKWGEEVR